MDEELAESQSSYLEAVKDSRINDAARALSETVVIPERLQRQLPEFRARLANQIRDWIARINNPHSALRQKSIAKLLLDNIGLIRQFGFELTENTMRYYRALIIADVIVLELDPDFDTVRGLNRYFHHREIRQVRIKANPQSVAWTSVEYFHMWMNGPRIARQLSRFLRRQEEDFGVVASQYVALNRTFARGSILAFMVVIIARLLGVPDVGPYIGFPISLNWLWFAPFLLVCWRVFSIVSR
jgi:predicted unusual protein kinase regulating ubiquinone biosynthesis (AarF/ABC1/UbiB family)